MTSGLIQQLKDSFRKIFFFEVTVTSLIRVQSYNSLLEVWVNFVLTQHVCQRYWLPLRPDGMQSGQQGSCVINLFHVGISPFLYNHSFTFIVSSSYWLAILSFYLFCSSSLNWSSNVSRFSLIEVVTNGFGFGGLSKSIKLSTGFTASTFFYTGMGIGEGDNLTGGLF